MTQTDKTFNDLPISYEIEENGYSIYLNGNLWITQYDKYSKMFDANATLEENCLMQIEELTAAAEAAEEEIEEATDETAEENEE